MSTKKSEGAQAALVRIAVTDTSSELAFECELNPSEIKKAVTTALAENTPLTLTDIRGHEIMVPAARIGYVEIGQPTERRVGFGAL
ncbi:MAG: DUF3107 domain-containing protein [Candidatus Planktophila sp.]